MKSEPIPFKRPKPERQRPRTLGFMVTFVTEAEQHEAGAFLDVAIRNLYLKLPKGVPMADMDSENGWRIQSMRVSS